MLEMTQKWFSCAAGCWCARTHSLTSHLIACMYSSRCCCCVKTTSTGASSAASPPPLLLWRKGAVDWTGDGGFQLLVSNQRCHSGVSFLIFLSLSAFAQGKCSNRRHRAESGLYYLPQLTSVWANRKSLMHWSIFIVSVVPSVELKERQCLYSLPSVFKSELAMLRLPCLLLSYLPFKHLVKQQIEMFNEKWVLSNCVEGDCIASQ